MGRIYQTSEGASASYLKTRWYKASYQMAKKKVLELIEKLGFTAEVTDDTYGEIFVETPKFDMTITIFEFSIQETSVDLTFESKMLFDFGKSKKIINDFYLELNKSLEFKGLSLHP
ncbi:MAG: hypothetical protein ACI35W_05315 [Anaeroplasmataceae bacterium]